MAFAADVHGYGVDRFLHQQGVDTTTPGGKALFQMMGVFAEFERATIRERVKSGLERAKAQGKRLGRRPIDARKEAAIRADLREGKAGIMKLAAAHGVGVGTVQRISRALALNAVFPPLCPRVVHRPKSILSDSGDSLAVLVGSRLFSLSGTPKTAVSGSL